MISNPREALRMILLSIAIAMSLVGCGGDGGDGGGAASTPGTGSPGGGSPGTPTPGGTATVFPFQSAYKALIANGVSRNFTVTGDCHGTGMRSLSAPTTLASFEGVIALAASGSLAMSLTDCTPATRLDSYTRYYDSNYLPLGTLGSDGVYGVYNAPPLFPASIAVGDSGVIGSEIYYLDSSRAIVTGTLIYTYAVEADSASTAIVNLISKAYTVGGTLVQTEQTRYRISTTGTLTPLNTDLQYAGASGVHMLLTYQ